MNEDQVLEAEELQEKWRGRIPPNLWGGIFRWVYDGIPPGDFLTAVIKNNLCQAFSRADEHSLAALHDIVSFFYNEVPAECWGSEQNFRSWMEKKQKPVAEAALA